MIFYFKNDWKNEFKDNKEKTCSWSRNRVSRKISFKFQWLRNSHADSVGVQIDYEPKIQSTIKIILSKNYNFSSIFAILSDYKGFYYNML